MKFFTADTHFGHEAVVTKMGRDTFRSIEEHDEEILDNINRMVGRTDQLYIIGDFAWQSAPKYRQRIRCKHVVLIRGNHDRPTPSKHAFGGAIHDMLTVKFQETRAVLCHYPMAYWDKSHYGSIHLYGHMHGQREDDLNILFPYRRAMDVGVDQIYREFGQYRPISEDEVLELLACQIGHDPVEFYRGGEDHE